MRARWEMKGTLAPQGTGDDVMVKEEPVKS